MSDIMKQLQAPFPASDIEWRVGSTNRDKSKGLALAYVTNRAIQNRLDEVFGPFGWQNTFREWKGNSQLCGISIKFEGEWITKWDGSDDSNTEATKGGLSDSMKRAGYQWGIGRYLYKLPSMWVPLKDGKYLAETPTLPDWALPENEQGKQRKPITKTSDYKATKETVFVKYKTLGCKEEEFEKWYTNQRKKYNDNQIESFLTKKLMDKKKGA